VRLLLGSLPSAVYRAKGFLYLAEEPDQRVVAHVVGRRVDLRPAGQWGNSPARTELVFVSLEDGIDTVGLRVRLAAAVAPEGSAPDQSAPDRSALGHEVEPFGSSCRARAYAATASVPLASGTE
jgi:hypothetical protein